jgi:hypothetical protein
MKKPNNFLMGLVISTIAFSVIPAARGATKLEKEFSLNYLNAPSSTKGNARIVISSETNAWSYSSYINTHTEFKNYDAFLPPCKESKIQVCIASVETRVGSGAWKLAQVTPDAGTPIGEIPTFTRTGSPASYRYSTFEGDLGNFLPPGGNPRLWKTEEDLLSGSMISVIADVHGMQLKETSGLALQIKLVTDKQDSASCSSIGGEWKRTEGTNPNSGYCNATLKIPSDLEFRVKLKFKGFHDPIKSWFTSTILNPNVDFTDDTLTISGGATSHANFVSDLIPFNEYCEIYRGIQPQYACPYTAANSYPNGSRSFLSREWGPSAMPFERYFQQKSLGEQNLWLFESTFQAPFNTTFHNQIIGCKLQNPILGVISTDAAMYTIADLKWNQAESSFEYSIFSPHLNSSGAVNSGFFSLLVDRTVGSCLWKENLSTAKAVLSISYEDGSSEISTTTLGKNDSWVKFSAAGFHYSRPKFSAKLDLSEKISTSNKPKVGNSTNKNSSIYCINGKKTVKISGSKPKCPKGYRLK